MRSTIAIAALTIISIAGNSIQLAYSQPANITLSPQFAPNPLELKGKTGGAEAVSEITGQAVTPTGPCTGFANTDPDHTITLKAFFKQLSMEVESSQDTAIAIRGPGGVWCNDDFQGKNPGVTGQWLAGKYEIWISTYGKNQTAPYVLKITGQ
ncbi:MAG: hypothetical protein IGS48_05315 [Oscillatoriales cyanobacterium C42_A2020_001]|nr:hypothetical protein [Leptolyngbyaceae cyanobacterium C42_A2020_001]